MKKSKIMGIPQFNALPMPISVVRSKCGQFQRQSIFCHSVSDRSLGAALGICIELSQAPLAIGFALLALITLHGVDLIRRRLAQRGGDRKPLETSSG